MEVDHLANRLVSQLSSGEARRLLVSRALAHRPRALVLDEPTNSLDLRACRDFAGCIRRLARQGTSLIMVTHHLPDIVPEIDRVVVLADGRVLRDGPKREVLTGPVLSEAFGVPVAVETRGGSTPPGPPDFRVSPSRVSRGRLLTLVPSCPRALG